MTLRIDNNITNDSPKLPVKAPVKQEQKQEIVPVGQKTEEDSTDIETPVKGYYIEKTKQTDDDDDELDTSDPDVSIATNPSIAIYKETDEINNTIKQTMERAFVDVFHDSDAEGDLKAADMMKSRQPYNSFDDIDFAKKFNIYGKVVYEGTNISYNTDAPAKIERQENSVKADLVLNYKSKSENTKAMLFSSFTKTNTKTLFTSLTSEDNEIPKEPIESDCKSYSLYGVVQQRFKNKDLGTLSAYHINDETKESKTSNVTASYFYKNMVMAQGSFDVYKVYNQKAITKQNFNISFNPELEPQEPKKTDEPKQEVEPNTDTKFVEESNAKKMVKDFSMSFDTHTINGKTEEGIEGKMRFKRVGNGSTFKTHAFGKVSTTQQEQNNKYHITFGTGIKYKKNFNTKSQLNASIDLKDRITFGEGNISTANATISYTAPKVNVEVEGKYINITHPDPHNYVVVNGKLFYLPNKNLNLFVAAGYTDMKEPNIRTKALNVQAGGVVNF